MLGLKWDAKDFIKHYRRGKGQKVTLSQISLLYDFINTASVQSAMGRVFANYKKMLKSALFARCGKCEKDEKNISENFKAHHFDEKYDVTFNSSNLFSLGDGELFNIGMCSGTANCLTQKWSGKCDLRFYIRDKFQDPLGVGVELGDVYPIHGDWNQTQNWAE